MKTTLMIDKLSQTTQPHSGYHYRKNIHPLPGGPRPRSTLQSGQREKSGQEGPLSEFTLSNEGDRGEYQILLFCARYSVGGNVRELNS